MAPELCLKEDYWGPPVDNWALACVVFEMLHGKAAFKGGSMEQLSMRIIRASHEMFAPETTSGARAFIKAGLKPGDKCGGPSDRK